MKNNMIIFIKNKHTLQLDEFKFRCCVGNKGLTKQKKEGDQKTPKGIFKIGKLFYRKDRIRKPKARLECFAINKNHGWCDDPSDKKNYNKLVNRQIVKKSEILFRKDHKYDLFIEIKYNTSKKILGKGSAIFLHLTKNYQGTKGCIALAKKDMMILLKLIKRNTVIKIT
jgi:L,D-peptidoglycan transpeptidase YkuD (ErfK/YbiS/YcfS/YnhG family)